MQPYSLNALHEPFSKITSHVVLYLPRTSDLRQIAGVVEDQKEALVMHYCMEGASKALCAYLGPFKVT
jgi:trimethylguanosine synthase